MSLSGYSPIIPPWAEVQKFVSITAETYLGGELRNYRRFPVLPQSPQKSELSNLLYDCACGKLPVLPEEVMPDSLTDELDEPDILDQTES